MSPRAHQILGAIVTLGALGLAALTLTREAPAGQACFPAPMVHPAEVHYAEGEPDRPSPGVVTRPRRSRSPTLAPRRPPRSNTPPARPAQSRYVRVPAGEFQMGSPPGEVGRSADEVQRTVRIPRPLMVKRTEVTQAEWAALMGSWPAYNARCSDCPVERINWYEAVRYVNARSRQEGLPACYTLERCSGAVGTGCGTRRGRPLKVCKQGLRCGKVRFSGPDCPGYRLPTEAEWEYFARAGQQTPWPGVGRAQDVGEVAWYAGNAGDRTHPVGRKRPNAWGLYDTSGNVWEWTHTLRDGGRVDRGGMYASNAIQVRLARQNDTNAENRRGFEVGLRPVRTILSE